MQVAAFVLYTFHRGQDAEGRSGRFLSLPTTTASTTRSPTVQAATWLVALRWNFQGPGRTRNANMLTTHCSPIAPIAAALILVEPFPVDLRPIRRLLATPTFPE